jgi:5-hydroxyisourate hydrolase
LGQLTTHVLDTVHGCPGAGVKVVLYREEERAPLRTIVTDGNGRCSEPLLDDAAMSVGCYRLSFEVGAYFRAKGLVLPTPAFLETIQISFGIADRHVHYHVPLLVSPYGYSTYRGS